MVSIQIYLSSFVLYGHFEVHMQTKCLRYLYLFAHTSQGVFTFLLVIAGHIFDPPDLIGFVLAFFHLMVYVEFTWYFPLQNQMKYFISLTREYHLPVY